MDVRTIAPEGSLIGPLAEPFIQELATAVEEGARSVVVDLTAVDFMTKHAVLELRNAAAVIRETGGILVLLGPGEMVRGLFRLHRIDESIQVAHDHAQLEELLGAFHGEAPVAEGGREPPAEVGDPGIVETTPREEGPSFTGRFLQRLMDRSQQRASEGRTTSEDLKVKVRYDRNTGEFQFSREQHELLASELEAVQEVATEPTPEPAAARPAHEMLAEVVPEEVPREELPELTLDGFDEVGIQRALDVLEGEGVFADGEAEAEVETVSNLGGDLGRHLGLEEPQAPAPDSPAITPEPDPESTEPELTEPIAGDPDPELEPVAVAPELEAEPDLEPETTEPVAVAPEPGPELEPIEPVATTPEPDPVESAELVAAAPEPEPDPDPEPIEPEPVATAPEPEVTEPVAAVPDPAPPPPRNLDVGQLLAAPCARLRLSAFQREPVPGLARDDWFSPGVQTEIPTAPENDPSSPGDLVLLPGGHDDLPPGLEGGLVRLDDPEGFTTSAPPPRPRALVEDDRPLPEPEPEPEPEFVSPADPVAVEAEEIPAADPPPISDPSPGVEPEPVERGSVELPPVESPPAVPAPARPLPVVSAPVEPDVPSRSSPPAPSPRALVLPGEVDAHLEVAADEDADLLTRWKAVRALGLAGDPRCRDLLEALAEGPEPSLRGIAAVSLRRLGGGRAA